MTATQTHVRLFTIEEAHQVLPEIEPLVLEMKRIFARIRREISTAARATGLKPGDPGLSGLLEQRGIAHPLVDEVNGLIQEIQRKGCLVNGPEAGLVDFPALLGSEIVYLCWRHGEDGIGHWHRIPEGYSGRKNLLDGHARGSSRPTVH